MQLPFIFWNMDNLVNIILVGEKNLLWFFISTVGRQCHLYLSRIILFSNDKTKGLFTPWKLGSIKKSKYWFRAYSVILDGYFFQLIVLSKPDSSCFNNVTLSWVQRVTAGKKSFVSVIVNVSSWFVQYQQLKTIFWPSYQKTNFTINYRHFKGSTKNNLMEQLFKHLLCHPFLVVLLFAV